MYQGTLDSADFYKVIFTGSQGQQQQVLALMLGEKAWGLGCGRVPIYPYSSLFKVFGGIEVRSDIYDRTIKVLHLEPLQIKSDFVFRGNATTYKNKILYNSVLLLLWQRYIEGLHMLLAM